MGDNLEDLDRQAHALYGETPTFEVIDADINAAVDRMIEIYGPPYWGKLERYFMIFDQVREIQYPPGSVQSWAEQRVRAQPYRASLPAHFGDR